MSAPNPESVLIELRKNCPLLARSLRMESTVSELCLDSMDTVELLCAVHERFGVRLSESEFQPSHTIGNVCRAIALKIHQTSI